MAPRGRPPIKTEPTGETTLVDELDNRIEADELLTAEDKAEIRARARADVLEERKKIETQRLYQQLKREEERAFLPNEQLEKFTVDLPEYTYQITIDGRQYYHGVTYTIPYSQARSMADIQARSWEHDREIQGHRRQGDVTRRPQHISLSPNHPQGRVTTTGNMRV